MGRFAAFFFMFFFIGLYAYYLGGETSMLMLYMLVLSQVVSFVLIFPLRKRLDISIVVPSSEVEKDGIVKVKLVIVNKTLIPVPFVDISFIKAKNLRLCDLYDMKVSLAPYETKTIVVKYNAIHRGVSEIGVERIHLRDYLGFFSFNLIKGFEDYQRMGKIIILPRIVNMKMNSKIMQNSGKTNTSEDAGAASTGLFSWTGEPGYDFREYEAGDPLHKIHWKLSAKTEKLMVRNNEGGGVPKKRLIIDPIVISNQKYKDFTKKKRSFLEIFNRVNIEKQVEEWVIEERILECVLSVANTMNRWGRTVEVWFYDENTWNMHTILDRKDIIALQHRFASYQFIGTASVDFSDRMPVLDIVSTEGKNRNFHGGEVVVFTGQPDELLQKSIESFSDYGMVSDMVLIKKSTENQEQQKDRDLGLRIPEQGNLWVLTTEEELSEAIL